MRPTSFLRRKRPVRWLLPVAGVAITLLLVTWWQRPQRVQVTRPARRDVVTSIATTGTVETQTASPGSETGGRIERLWVRQGERVRAGQVLATLDTRDLPARLREAGQALEAARLKREATSTEAWRPQFEQAEAALEQAQVRARQAERDWQDLRTLAAGGAVPQVEAENARAALLLARLQQAEGAARIRQLRQQKDREREQATVAVASAAAARDALLAQIDRARITAPASGIVTEINSRAGETLAPGAPLLKIARGDSLRVAVPMDEQYFAQVHPGQQVRLAADAYPNQPFSGRVEKIDPAVDPEQGTIKAVVRPDEPPDYLRPDMTLDVNIVTGRYPRALTIPRAALAGPPTAQQVWRVTAEGRAQTRSVRVIVGDMGDVAVLRGLTPEDRVILNPPPLRPGQRVQAEGTTGAK